LRRLQTHVERSSYLGLDARVKGFLASILGMRLPSVRIYANQASDAALKAFGADALTYEDKVLFSAGNYDPRDPAGIALLGHELTHAALSRTQSQSKLPYGIANTSESEERVALENERKVLHYFSMPQPHGALPAPPGPGPREGDAGGNRLRHTGTSAPRVAPAARDRSVPQVALAPQDRSVVPEPASKPDTSLLLTWQQLEQVRRYLMDEIRHDFARGG
jgi:hypothetical protein